MTSSSLPASGGGGGGVDHRCQVTKVDTVLLHGVAIVSLLMEGKERLCLAQISSTLLKSYSYNEIHNRRVALGITCVQCTPVQLEILRRAGAMPVSSRRCGMITRREAERLVKSFLDDIAPPKLPDNFVFDVEHDCGWGCRGSFHPARYNSSRAKCIQCVFCDVFYSPNKFIFHFHRTPGAKYNHPDAANFNSWRRHLKLTPGVELAEGLLHAWEDVKAMFNGGNRRRIQPGGHHHHHHPHGTAKIRRLGERGPGKDSHNSTANHAVPLIEPGTGSSSLRPDDQDTQSTGGAQEDTAAAADLHRQFNEVKGHSVQGQVTGDDGRVKVHPVSNSDSERNKRTDQREDQETDKEEDNNEDNTDDNDTDTGSIDVDTVEEETAAPGKRKRSSGGKDGIGFVDVVRKRSVSVEKMNVDSMEEEPAPDQSPAEDEEEEFHHPGQIMVADGRTWKMRKNSVGDKMEYVERDIPAESFDVRQQQANEGQRQRQQQQQQMQQKESEQLQRDNRRPKWKSSFDGKWSFSRDHEEPKSAGFHPYLSTLSKEELKQKLSTEMEVRAKMEKEFRHLKDSLSSEVERQKERREDSDRRLEHLKELLYRELDQERKIRISLQHQLQEARDTLRTLSYGLLVPAAKSRCAACAYRDSFSVSPSISFLSNVNVAFTGK